MEKVSNHTSGVAARFDGVCLVGQRGAGHIMLDARKPNLKKTNFGAVLPIDLILADLTIEIRDMLATGSSV